MLFLPKPVQGICKTSIEFISPEKNKMTGKQEYKSTTASNLDDIQYSTNQSI